MLGKRQGVPRTPRGILWRLLCFLIMAQDKGGDRKGSLFSSGILMASVVMTSGSHSVARPLMKF